MDKLNCSRCKNEELRGNDNYCPICGLNLKEEIAREASVQEQLINLIEGMPLYKWEQLKSCIDREFKSQANKTAFKKSNTFKKTLDLEFTH